jgi:hypothetical protein
MGGYQGVMIDSDTGVLTGDQICEKTGKRWDSRVSPSLRMRLFPKDEAVKKK